MVREALRAGLENFLKEKGIRFRILKFREKTTTVKEAEKALGISRDKIVKTLVFIDDSGSPVAAIVTGDKKVDEKKLAMVCNAKKVKIASPREVEMITGFEVGGLPPVGHGLRTIIDKRVMRNEVVYGGGGDSNSLLEIATADLKKLADAIIEDIAK
ncbi:MAG: hypothetical protein DRJ41_03320 [Thermoprotei archaeon]|nr:MAG: hypothetical protein DRJ41_03320 [Thermoprotei archaeon]